MLKAFDVVDNQELLSYENIINKKHNFICPYCKSKVFFVDAELKIKHFRHESLNDCESEPETWEHMEMKKFFIEKLDLKKENIEVDLGYARPDLYKEYLGKKLAIEVQHSPLSEKKFIERTSNYAVNNIFVLWVFDINLLKNSDECNIPAFLRKAQSIYYGQVYFFNWIDKNKEFNPNITPIHFQPTGNYIEPNDFSEHNGYFKWYKKQKKIIKGNPITDFNFKFTTNVNNPKFTSYNWKGSWRIGQFNSPKFWTKTESPKIVPKIEEEYHREYDKCVCGNWKKIEYDECFECHSGGFI